MSRIAQFVVLVSHVGYAVGLLVTRTLVATRNPILTFVFASIATLADQFGPTRGYVPFASYLLISPVSSD